MSIRDILTDENRLLRKRCQEIDYGDKDILQLANDLKETLYSTNGLGLSAPQIGVSKRMILVNLYRGKREILLVNPRIVLRRGSVRHTESCLSCGKKIVVIDRPESIMVVAKDIHWKNRAIRCSGIMARAICHEIDHLNGILMMDNAIVIKMEKGAGFNQ